MLLPLICLRIFRTRLPQILLSTRICLHIPVQILLSCSLPTPNVTLRLIHVQYFPGLRCQCRIDLGQTVCHILMYSTLTDTKFFGSLAHGGIVVNNVFGNLYRSFFDILFQGNSPHTSCFYNVCGAVFLYSYHIAFKISRIASALTGGEK